MILDHLAKPLTRSWCIFELLQTLKLQRNDSERMSYKATGASFHGLLLCTSGGVLNVGNGSVEVAMNVVKRVATLDLESADSSVESDKQMINQLVVEDLGSFESMNRFVRKEVRKVLATARNSVMSEFETLFSTLPRESTLLGDDAESVGTPAEDQLEQELVWNGETYQNVWI